MVPGGLSGFRTARLAPGREPKGPATVIVKLPSSKLKSRRLCKRFSLYKREYDYYRRLAPHVPLRTPTLLYGDYEPRNDRFVLVLEDLRAMATADQIVGASAEQAKRAIRGIARLHGHYWNKVDQAALSGSRNELSPYISPRAAMIAQDFARVRVLASGGIATPYGVASMCAHAGKRPARARPAQLYRAGYPQNVHT